MAHVIRCKPFIARIARSPRQPVAIGHQSLLRQKLKDNHTKLCASVDKPVAGLLHDLKQRGMLEDTVVVFCTEFGRTPGLELRGGGKDGRETKFLAKCPISFPISFSALSMR